MKKLIYFVLFAFLLSSNLNAQGQLSDLTTVGLNPVADPIALNGTTQVIGTIENAWNGSVSPNVPLITLQLVNSLNFIGVPTIVTGLGNGYIDAIHFTIVSQTATKMVIRITDSFPAFKSLVLAYPVKGTRVNVGSTENLAFKVEYDTTPGVGSGHDSDNDGTNNNNSSTLNVQPIVINPDINATFVNKLITGNVNTNDLVVDSTTYGTPALLPGSPAGSVVTINMNADGTYNFTADKPGVYIYNVPICFPISSGIKNCTSSLLTINVSSKVFTGPVANTDIAGTLNPNPVTLQTLANDNSMMVSYPLNPSTVTVISQPKNGTTSVDPSSGNITYTPTNPNFVGNDTLFYQVCTTNPVSSCATAMQIITVLSPVTSPNSVLAADDFAKTVVNISVSGNALTNDTDPEGEGLIVTPQADVSIYGGTYSIDAQGNYTFIPNPKFVGSTNFVYHVCDTHSPVAACTAATVYIDVDTTIVMAIGFQSFDAAWSGNNGSIAWKGSGKETSGTYYMVERSTDGQSYTDIAKVNSVSGAGNYGYIDKEIASTILSNTTTFYYRLKMVDIDGSSKYSTVALLKRTAVVNSINLYPNPGNGVVHFNNLQNVTAIELWSSVGQLLQRVTKVDTQTLTYNFNVNASGMYVIVLRMEDGSSKKLPWAIVK